VAPGMDSPPCGPGTLSWWQGGENTTLQILGGPLEMLQDRDWEGTEVFGKQFIKQAISNSADSCPKAKHWEQRGLSLHNI
jgi:hypothetical protein